jgi:NitT/TauT family transport system ATP-binding protein
MWRVRAARAGGAPVTLAAGRESVRSELGTAARAKLSIRAVSKTFNGTREVHALDDVSLDIQDGEFVCLVGPSGCGKSTLLNLIAGLERADAGSIRADDEQITGPGPDRLVMFQESALFPWLNVLDNVLFGLHLKHNLAKSARHDVAMHYLRLVGLERFASSAVHELSGGMKQRVALAR